MNEITTLHSLPPTSLRGYKTKQPVVCDGTAKLRIFPKANIYAAGLLPLRVLRQIIYANLKNVVNGKYGTLRDPVIALR